MKYQYQDTTLTVDKRVKDLLYRMSVDEKIGQLCKIDGFQSYNRDEENISIIGDRRSDFALRLLFSVFPD